MKDVKVLWGILSLLAVVSAAIVTCADSADAEEYPASVCPECVSENDARVNPLHARKMIARMQEADPDGEPILYRIERDSGHGYGTTLTVQIKHYAEEFAFLMNRLGMEAPE